MGIGLVVPFDLNMMLSSIVMADVMLVTQGTVASQLVKLLSVVDYDEVPVKHGPWKPKWRLYLALMIIEITVQSVVWDRLFCVHLSM